MRFRQWLCRSTRSSEKRRSNGAAITGGWFVSLRSQIEVIDVQAGHDVGVTDTPVVNAILPAYLVA